MNIRKSLILLIAVSIVWITALELDAQSTRRKSSRPRAVTSATPPPNNEPAVISRAEDYREIPAPIVTIQPEIEQPAKTEAISREADERIAELSARIKELESDHKQRRLLLNLDILTRAEQRSESLRRQRFELITKEGEITAKLDEIHSGLRPEMIERTTSLTGSLRPEELRDARQKSLESEKKKLEMLLTEIQSTKANLDVGLERSDVLVERLRDKLEKEIEDSLADEKPLE